VPAELVGQRRRGLTRYVMSLMNGARIAISAQALGIAEAAFREAHKYAREREQFGQPIIKFPAVYGMLLRSRVDIAAVRALLYEATRYVDLRDIYEEINKHAETKDREFVQREKYYTKIASTLTPLAKAMSTEMANQVAYDGIQVHGGTGYMKDFAAERLYRDARITNIYEGTTQLQYVAGIGGVVQRILEPLMDKISHLPFEGRLRRLASRVDMAREKLNEAVKQVENKDDSEYFSLMTGTLCEMEIAVFVSYLLLRDAFRDKEKTMIAEIFIQNRMPQFDKLYQEATSGNTAMIDNYEDILGDTGH